jgi:hypothetical protein
MALLIKVIISLGVICFLRVLIWQDSKRNPFHLGIKEKFGNRSVSAINYSALLLIGSGAIVVIFSFPNSPSGLLIGGVLGLIGALIGM